MDLPPEVLIYIQQVREFMKKDDKAREYFIFNGDEDFFYEHLIKISYLNFKDNGEAMLTVDQFEVIRNTMILIYTIKKPVENNNEDKIFFTYKDFGKICLN